MWLAINVKLAKHTHTNIYIYSFISRVKMPTSPIPFLPPPAGEGIKLQNSVVVNNEREKFYRKVDTGRKLKLASSLSSLSLFFSYSLRKTEKKKMKFLSPIRRWTKLNLIIYIPIWRTIFTRDIWLLNHSHPRNFSTPDEDRKFYVGKQIKKKKKTRWWWGEGEGRGKQGNEKLVKKFNSA